MDMESSDSIESSDENSNSFSQDIVFVSEISEDNGLEEELEDEAEEEFEEN